MTGPGMVEMAAETLPMSEKAMARMAAPRMTQTD